MQINFCGLEHVPDGNACLTHRWRLPHRFIHYGKNYSSVIDVPHVRVQGLWNTGGVVTACLWSLATSHSLPPDSRSPPSPPPPVLFTQEQLIIVLSGRRHGLIASLTRIVHFGPLPSDAPLRLLHRAVTRVDAVAIANTVVGATSDTIMASIQKAYEEVGFVGEWLHHHQGGATGYRSREWKAEPGVRYQVGRPQAFAWNPSVAGPRSEDTILVGAKEGCDVAEVLTATPSWPMIKHVVNGIEIERPDVYEVIDD